jgi:DNA invertase Pin-like site-specific DNA recombinase
VKLDRLARSVHHLVAMAREFEALGVDLVVLDQAIDTTTPSGRLLFHVLASVAEFEREVSYLVSSPWRDGGWRLPALPPL